MCLVVRSEIYIGLKLSRHNSKHWNEGYNQEKEN